MPYSRARKRARRIARARQKSCFCPLLRTSWLRADSSPPFPAPRGQSPTADSEYLHSASTTEVSSRLSRYVSFIIILERTELPSGRRNGVYGRAITLLLKTDGLML